ncbi:CHASE2 domain-containing protein [Calothrix sp. UHCC 0171]|uniref:CHASE2 domain-containing protein n=1 Tax=Calothrix sp. UHCC 0171 TaxID=3110245 RepID=UPI002B1F1B5E|nr:CHASE2 domain-containing protein [Calothrix sp. UHCC 0171]MEA5574022.1 CHASE2 domain-containing protein [Calothrix sp. UHCC 0171]
MAKFYLQVQKIEKKCLFQLSWNQNQTLTAELHYPENIISDYKNWQSIYHNFYSQELRGKVINTGVVAPPPVDWQAQLVQAEAKLLCEFHQWLRGKELYDIRSILTANNFNSQNINNPNTSKYKHTSTDVYTDIFISCNTPELTRLPWEAWEINSKSLTTKLSISRQPLNIHQDIKNIKKTPGKIRILAIFGDDSGLSFEKEKQAILALQKLIKVDLISWREGTDIQKLKSEIVNKLTSVQGWDILFFAGHSRETNLTGGQISIAPNATISLSEIEKPLATAIAQGLKFALFNSCDGLSIANKLVELGLNQVAIMREPIHNRVAEEIFVQFLNNVAQYQDVHQALLAACDYLKLEKNLTYPSAYLIPSLFRHPSAPLFRLEPFGFKQYLKRLKPTPLEAAIISALALISLQIPVQTWLLEKRVLVQAIYRNLTNQVEEPVNRNPHVILVQIDNESIQKANILSPRPINREYMAQIIDKLVELKAPVVGIDYLLDRPDLERDRILNKSLQSGLKSTSTTTRFVFATTRDSQGKWLSVHPQIANPNWSLAGEIEILPGWYVQLLPSHPSNSNPRALAYLLAVSERLQHYANSPKPQLNSRQDFWQQVNNYIAKENTILTPERTRLQPLTAFSYNLQQMWLHPIIDFSIPPQQVYKNIPAWKLLESHEKLQGNIIIVAPGGYEEAGTGQNNEDNFELPAAMGYWRNQENPDNTRGVLTGGEVHAYMTHHYLNNRMIIPIPDLWMVALGILLGKFTSEYLSNNPEQKRQVVILLSVGSTVYTLISLQTYISSSAILVPLLSPITTFGFYIVSAVFKTVNHKLDDD